MNLKNAVADAMLTAIRSEFNDGGGTAHLNIYSAAYAALLVSYDLATSNPFGAPAAGASTYRQIAVTTGGDEDFTKVGLAAAGAGTNAAVYRYLSEAGDNMGEGACGASGSGAEVELSNVNIAENQPTTLTSAVIRINATLGA